MDPYVVYRHVFGQPVKEYWLRDFGYIRLFVIALVSLACLKTDWLITNGLISIGVSATVLGLTAAADRAFIRKQLTGLEIWINSKS